MAVVEEVSSSEHSVLNWALAYARRGWRVLPIWSIENGRCTCGATDCRSPGKHPIGYMVPDGMKSASADPDTITAWAKAAPNMNLAVATGNASNLVVLDLDIREVGDDIIDGEFELKSWLAARGIDLPSTLVQRTGGGGAHILMHWPAPANGPRPSIASRTNWLPGVDIRADGGYIVVAPSQHVSGKMYQWESRDVPSLITSDLLELLSRERKQSSTTGATLGPSTESLSIQRLIAEGFRMGGRDDGFIRLVGMLRARGDSMETAKAILKAVWDQTDQTEKDYYPFATALEKLERGYRNWEAPEQVPFALVEWAVESDARAKNYEPPLVTPSGVKVDTSTGEIIEDEEDEEDQDRDPTAPFDVAGLMLGGEIERELPSMLLRSDGKGLIYPGRLHSIYGEPGHGKTWVSLFLVREQIESGNVVAYLDYDEDDGGKSMASRLLSLGADVRAVSSNLRYLNPQGLGTDMTAWKKLKSQLKEWQPSLVVVDTMAPALVELGLNEKDNAEVGAWYAHARWLMRGIKPQAALVIVDHVTKSGEGRGRWARGAGDKLGRLHAAYAVESSAPFSRTTPGHIQLVIAKDRGGEVGRQGDTAATVHFTPSNEGKSLDIRVDVPSSASLSDLAQQNDNRRMIVLDRIVRALSEADGPMTYAQIKKAAKATKVEEVEVIDSAIADGILVQCAGTQKNPTYQLAEDVEQ